uniref:NADH:ubiquinone oxidoreductase intermediate-associated protein 30 domain-containing protein n=1 Tax=Odontella aurita TaxID=265563 RepID=A0A7S4JAJ1_9STRA|mmetsp:Transcript_42558/g.129128  ORF Transcript_42558/g.129128 Transcript_42558/m.129128 type:complete len:367 (+) Transcript_42558:92-1192(+)
MRPIVAYICAVGSLPLGVSGFTTPAAICGRRASFPHRQSLALKAAADSSNSDEQSISDDVLQSLTAKLERTKNEAAADAASAVPAPKPGKKDNDAMAFLRKVGRVGGAANKNFVNAVGSDEGTTGRQPPVDRESGAAGAPGQMRKSKSAYMECTASGTIDDLTEPFPSTSSGTEWRGVSDRVIGGISNGSVRRELDLEGRPCNVLAGRVSVRNGGGFVQMVTDLPLDPAIGSVDASDFDGIELDVICKHEPKKFNVHLRTPGTLRQESYRYTHDLAKNEGEPLADEGGAIQGGWSAWRTVRIPWSSFEGYCTDEEEPVCETMDASAIKRIGIVAMADEEEGKETGGFDAFLAVAGVRFYNALDLLL